MDPMVAKGLLTARKVRNLTLYRSAATPAQQSGTPFGCWCW